MSWNSTSSEEARRKAENKFAKAKKREANIVNEQSKSRQVLDDKVARLRALRLSKAAADREAAAQEPAAKKSPTARKRAAA